MKFTKVAKNNDFEYIRDMRPFEEIKEMGEKLYNDALNNRENRNMVSSKYLKKVTNILLELRGLTYNPFENK